MIPLYPHVRWYDWSSSSLSLSLSHSLFFPLVVVPFYLKSCDVIYPLLPFPSLQSPFHIKSCNMNIISPASLNVKSFFISRLSHVMWFSCLLFSSSVFFSLDFSSSPPFSPFSSVTADSPDKLKSRCGEWRRCPLFVWIWWFSMISLLQPFANSSQWDKWDKWKST